MSYGYLEKMLEMLTSAYTRRDLQNLRHNQPLETNIGKVFSLFATGLEIIRENAELVRLWDNIDNAEGAVLDRYGANFGVERGAASDGLYRILIRVKMIAQLSGGDDDTVIRAAGELLGVDFSDILRTYIVKQYGHWAEYKATDKTALRSFLYGRIDSIVELNK